MLLLKFSTSTHFNSHSLSGYSQVTVCSLPLHLHYSTLPQSLENLSHKISVMFFIGFSIRCYPFNLVSQTSDIPNHISTMKQKKSLLSHQYYSQHSQQTLIQHTLCRNFQQHGKCLLYFHLPTNLYNHPCSLFPFLRQSPNYSFFQIIHTTSINTTILSKNPFTRQGNGTMNWGIWWVMSAHCHQNFVTQCQKICDSR